MSSNTSDSEEFFDAVDSSTSISSGRRLGKSSRDSLHRTNSEPIITSNETKADGQPAETDKDIFVQPKQKETPRRGRRKFNELRNKLQADDEESQGVVNSNSTPPNSPSSSIDGVYSTSTKSSSQPFRVIEQDTVSLQSITSGGRTTRLISGIPDGNTRDCVRKTASVSALSSTSLDSEEASSWQQYPSTSTILVSDKLKLQEPDVIASTKVSSTLATTMLQNSAVENNSVEGNPPIAPPRRKKRLRNAALGLALKKSASSIAFKSSDLNSPASTIESLTRELEHSLDRLPSVKSTQSDKSTNSSKSSTLHSGYSLNIKEAVKGQFVVKPQDISPVSNKTRKSNSLDTSDSVVLSLSMKNTNDEQGSNETGNRSSVGHYSLGPHRGARHRSAGHSSRERRKSAGDESLLKDINLKVHTHTNSGKQLSDFEILQQVTVLNLDTGERVPLSIAEDKLPQCINPLSLHIMRLTSEYVSSSSMEKDKETDEESVDTSKKSESPCIDDSGEEIGKMRRRKAAIFRRFVGTAVKRTMYKAKSIAQGRHKEDMIDVVDVVHPGEQNIKLRTSHSHKGPTYEFEKVEHVQEISDVHEGPVWCMKFSCCGRLLATAGQDKVLRVWVVSDAFQFFQDMRIKYNAEVGSPTSSQECVSSVPHINNVLEENVRTTIDQTNDPMGKQIFIQQPFCTYSGHTSDLLDISWSKNYFILSSSMDKTVRLWHISRKECLCCFQHIDFVTAIAFHPRDNRYFLSGSLDGKLRLWNIPDKKVALWNEVEGNPKLITAANFCQNGKFAVVGTYDGRCIFYHTDQLKYHTQIHVRSSRGRNATGRKISGIEPMPGEDKILVTSNDSRIRLYDLRDLSISCKYKGYVNMSSQIKASFSHDGKFVVSGSENRDIYIWKTNHDYAKFSSVRRDRNDYWEAIKAHNAVVTCAIFAPNSEAIIKMIDDYLKTDEAKDPDTDKNVNDPVVEQHTKGHGGYVLISADFNGSIRVFINKTKPKHSSLPVTAMV